MKFAIQMCGFAVGVPLQLMVIVALLRGGWRRFPIILAYSVASCLATIFEMPFYIFPHLSKAGGLTRAKIYWLDESALIALTFLMVLSLIWQATTGLRSRRLVRGCLVAGALAFVGVSFAVRYNPHANATGQWMTGLARDLDFGAAILDLALWTLLLASPSRERLLLVLSGALGVQFTGEAIGGSIRDLAISLFGNRPSGLLFFGNIVMMTANLVCPYLWWRALREPGRRTAEREPEGRGMGAAS